MDLPGPGVHPAILQSRNSLCAPHTAKAASGSLWGWEAGGNVELPSVSLGNLGSGNDQSGLLDKSLAVELKGKAA